MKATDILEKAAQHMRDRAATYDKPEGERSMGKTVDAFNAITGRNLTTAEGWLMLAVLKQVRVFQAPEKAHVDSLEDGPAYLALMAEEMLSVSSAAAVEPPAEKPWYPDDSGEWVEVPDSLMERPAALAKNTRVEVLFRREREIQVCGFDTRKARNFEWRISVGNAFRIVAYKIIEEAQQ